MGESAKEVGQWLPAARAGSQEALGQALDAFRGYLLLIAEQELDSRLQAKGGASDLVQETLLDALRDFGHFQGNSEPELKAWLRQLLVYNVVDFTRHYRAVAKRQVAREVMLETGPSSAERGGDLAASIPTPSRQAIDREQTQAIQQALERLPEDYRRVILMRYQDERSFEEIGQLLGLTPNAARKLWVRAVKRLQEESTGRA
jgi:RNA polymerase sigma-70 factor (ECF subfamily)